MGYQALPRLGHDTLFGLKRIFAWFRTVLTETDTIWRLGFLVNGV